MKIMEEQKIGAHSLVCSTSRVEGCVGASGWNEEK
jgi:hypothetical protein